MYRLMRAVVITSHGGVDGIGVLEVESPPTPVADRVRVRVHAAGLNRADILQRRGSYPAPPGYPQNIPGLEFAGEVDAIGDGAGAWKIGDRVFGITAGGAQAELVVVPESNLARVPAVLDWVQAGAMPETFITAHDALFTRAGLHMGERVLVHAAASGVGTAAIQLAHAAQGPRNSSTYPYFQRATSAAAMRSTGTSHFTGGSPAGAAAGIVGHGTAAAGRPPHHIRGRPRPMPGPSRFPPAPLTGRAVLPRAARRLRSPRRPPGTSGGRSAP